MCSGLIAPPKIAQRLLASVGLGPRRLAYTFNKRHAHRHSYFENIDSVFRVGKFFKAARHDFRLQPCEFQRAHLHIIVVRNQLQEKRHIRDGALRPHTLDPRPFLIVDAHRAERRIIQKHFDAVRAFGHQPLDRVARE